MIEYLIGGAVLLVGAIGKALSGSDNSGANHIGSGLEKLSSGTMNKFSELGEARERASGMSDSELLRKARSGSTIDRAASAAEYKSRHSDD